MLGERKGYNLQKEKEDLHTDIYILTTYYYILISFDEMYALQLSNGESNSQQSYLLGLGRDL